jgi:hypothetical protein
VAQLLAKFDTVLARQNDRDIKKEADELKKALDELERRF